MMSLKEVALVYIDFLSGKKAYIVGALMIALGFMQNNLDLMMQGLGVIALRAGITKSGNITPTN